MLLVSGLTVMCRKDIITPTTNKIYNSLGVAHGFTLHGDNLCEITPTLRMRCLLARPIPGSVVNDIATTLEFLLTLVVNPLTGINPGKSHGQGPWVSRRDGTGW